MTEGSEGAVARTSPDRFLTLPLVVGFGVVAGVLAEASSRMLSAADISPADRTLLALYAALGRETLYLLAFAALARMANAPLRAWVSRGSIGETSYVSSDVSFAAPRFPARLAVLTAWTILNFSVITVSAWLWRLTGAGAWAGMGAGESAVVLARQTPWALHLLVVHIVVFTPLVEELYFRRMWIVALARSVPMPTMSRRLGAARSWRDEAGAILVSAMIFTLAHAGAAAWPVVLLSGAMFGLSFTRSGSLLPAILAHSLNNAAGLAALWMTSAYVG